MNPPDKNIEQDSNAVEFGHPVDMDKSVQPHRSLGRRVADVEAIVTAERLANLELIEAERGRIERDNRNRKISSRLAYVIAGLAVGLTLLLFFVQQNRLEETIVNQAKESAERRDQNCDILEAQHLASIQSLEVTYKYLVDLNETQLREPLNRLILSQLATSEQEARTDQAPPYCDVRNVGLPEPDPEIPLRPGELDRFVKEATQDLRSPDARDAGGKRQP